MEFEYGNLQGVYYSPYKLEQLKEIAQKVSKSFPKVQNYKIWYDSAEDFHYLEFSLNNHTFQVRYYKIFCLLVDNKVIGTAFANGIIRLIKDQCNV